MSESRVASVGSSIYNLAGTPAGRPNYLKSLVIGSMGVRGLKSGDIVTQGYLEGPGVRIKSFLSWVHNNPEFLARFGTTTGTVLARPRINNTTVAQAIQTDIGQEAHVETTEVGDADLVWWVMQQIALNHNPIPIYTYNSNSETLETTISYRDSETGEVVSTETFTPVGFDKDARYLYARYRPVLRNSLIGDPVYDAIVDVTGGEFPNLDGWTEDSITTPTVEETLETWEEADITYSDNRTPVHVDLALVGSRVVSSVENHGLYHKDEFQGVGPAPAVDSTYAIRSFYKQDLTYAVEVAERSTTTTRTIEGGVIETTTTTRYVDTLKSVKKYQFGSQTLIVWSWLDPRYYIYKEQSGKAALDAFFQDTASSTDSGLYPVLPLRYNNVSITGVRVTWRVDLPFEWPLGDARYEVWLARDFGHTSKAIRLFPMGEADSPDLENGIWPYLASAWEEDELVDDVLHGATSSVVKRIFHGSNGDEVINWGPLKARPVAQPNSPKDVDYAPLLKPLKNALRHALDMKWEKLQRQILKNKDIGDIDYAYLVFGASLNNRDKSARKYIYRFLQSLMQETAIAGEEDTFYEEFAEATLERQRMDEGSGTDQALPTLPVKTFKITSNHPDLGDYITTLQWAFISEEMGSGLLQRPDEVQKPTQWTIDLDWDWWYENDALWIAPSADRTAEAIRVNYVQLGEGEDVPEGAYPFVVEAYTESQWEQFTDMMEANTTFVVTVGSQPDGSWAAQDIWYPLVRAPQPLESSKQWSEALRDAKVGELWFNTGDRVTAPNQIYLWGNDRFELCWQESTSSWRKLSVSDFVYWNHVYKTSNIRIKAYDAIVDPKENGFIIPLHNKIFSSIGLVDRTQLASMCGVVVLNSYVEVQKQWYEEDWFKIVIVVVTVVVSIILAYFTGGATLGIGGALVESLALSGATAVVVGAAVNALVGILIGQLITEFTSYLQKNGGNRTDTAVAGLVLSLLFSIVTSGGNIGSLFEPSSLMSLATSISQIAIQAAGDDLTRNTEKYMKTMSTKISDLIARYEEEFGSKNQFDPEIAKKFINELVERPEMFLKRTLLTGSDIVGLTTSMVSNFTDYTLKLELP